MKVVKLSLQEFAMPSPRRGSIEPSSVFNTTMKKGVELHQKVQELRALENSDYRKEVSLSWSFEKDQYRFEVSGRLDGLFEGTSPRIEEIKSSFNIFEMAKNIKEKRFEHPYFLQLVSYGYFYWLQEKIKPELNFYLISSRRDETFELDISWKVKEYEQWLERRLEELVKEAVLAEKRLKRRKKLNLDMTFPFSRPRVGQMELMEFIEKGILNGKKMMIQAPTGLGKTMGVLFPALKDALTRGQRVVYLTPKNSQQIIAEEAVEKIQAHGCQVKSLTITAKSKICMKAEPLCNPDYCEYAKDYYDKLIKYDLKSELSRKKKLTAKVMKNFAAKYEVCPFELQLEAVSDADVIICDYNYVFGHQSSLGKISSSGFEQDGKPNLIIDEAHNLPSRTMGNFSPQLSGKFLEGLRGDLEDLSGKFRRNGLAMLDLCLATLNELTPSKMETKSLKLDFEYFISVNEELKSFLSEYLDSDVEIKSGDAVLKMVFYWGGFTDVLSELKTETSAFFITGQNDGKNRSVKITCCDASGLIQERYDYFKNLILFSATLKPFDYYAKLAGVHGMDLIQEEFQSPFNQANRKILIIPQISTKFSVRTKNYPKIADAMEKIIKLKEGNYLAFFPSFDFMENVLSSFRIPEGTRLLKQKRFMKNDEVEDVIGLLRSGTTPMMLFAVQGGVFSEGIDYAGETAIGAFIVGPPLPGFDFERELMREYYQTEYQAGLNFAYTFPAMAKAVQAAGRVIRSENDRGIIILMDDRFLEKSFSQSLPQDWFETGPQELVSKSILSDISHFWNETLSDDE